MAKKGDLGRQSLMVYEVDPTECPFREFRDNELSPDFWGMSPAAIRASHYISKTTSKVQIEYVWVDDQAQPLPRSARQYLHGWIRAEELAMHRVVVPKGWPLTLAQWTRVDQVRNSQEFHKVETATVKKPTKDKGPSKEKDKIQPVQMHQPQPGDAYVELECSLAIGGGSVARRDDTRDLQFTAARSEWDALEPARNLRGAQIRKEFRAEFLEALPPPPSGSEQTLPEEVLGEETLGEEKKVSLPPVQQGPTPATESGLLEISVESEEEAKYLSMPEQLKDKFIQLYFVPFCTKEIDEKESVVVTRAMAELAERERQQRIDAALSRTRELQAYNEACVLHRQRCRAHLLEKLFVDSQWNPELNEVLEERDEAIAREALNRTLSATKKKQEAKKK